MFKVPASKKSIKQNRFEFELDGRQYDIPLLKFAPVAAAELLEQGKQIAALMMMLNDDSAAEAVRSLDGDQFGALMDAWAEASGVDAGE